MSLADDEPPVLSIAKSPGDLVNNAIQFVQYHFRNHDCSHDFHHLSRVHLLALHLSTCSSLPAGDEGDEIDLLVLELAAFFHDLCDRKYLPPSASSSSSKVSAAQVLAPFWQQCVADTTLLSESQRLTVEKIVDNVSWSKDEARRKAIAAAGGEMTLEQSQLQQWMEECPAFQCVSDADRLESIGSMGIMRCAAYSCKTSRPLFIPPSPHSSTQSIAPPHEQSPGYNESAIAHFYQKLLLIKGDRLWTDMAKKEAERRQRAMESFLMELEMEWLVMSQGRERSLLMNDEDREEDEEP